MMSNDVVIKVENISKKFSRSLRQMMYYGVKDITKSTLGILSSSDKLRKGEFWALDDVSFELKRGETLGIIGPNGSGKTTVLKMLNGILMPDKGRIEIKGKVGALIEVGAGFHPMLTGRENIYVSGAVLGMNKKEIDKKFETIVEFADIGDFLDSPVKHYSSGMYVRLGFAVAVHCEPDILLMDEILAVGDASFQAKCLKRMRDLKNSQTTIVFVSHDILSVRRICDRSILLLNGKIEITGNTPEVVSVYENRIIEVKGALLSQAGSSKDIGRPLGEQKKSVEITSVKFLGADGKEKGEFDTGEPMTIQIQFYAAECIKEPTFQIVFWSADGTLLSGHVTNYDGYEIKQIEGAGVMEVLISELCLLPGVFKIDVAICDKDYLSVYDWHYKTYSFKVRAVKQVIGLFALPLKWQLIKK